MENTSTVADKLQFTHDLSASSMYLMGGSFVLGSLFTILLLIVLDFVRRKNDGK